MVEMERALTKLYAEHDAEEAAIQEGEAFALQQPAGIQTAQQNLGQQQAVVRRNATRRQRLRTATNGGGHGPGHGTVYGSAEMNYGPRTCCYPHRDQANLSFGWCAVTAMGNYDFTKGGHLVLWDLKLTIEFPPGTTMLFPSAVLLHSNTEIGPDEDRYSMTQYSAGGLFRWVHHGCRTLDEYLSSLSPKELQEYERENEERWLEALRLYSKCDLTS